MKRNRPRMRPALFVQIANMSHGFPGNNKNQAQAVKSDRFGFQS